ncbi:MAG: hypothetical protein ACRD09_05915 [Vicinamibacterales bacterium]
MTTADDDRNLRNRFAALRAEDERLAPDLRRAFMRPGPPRGSRRLGLALSGLAALAALAFFLGQSATDRAPEQSTIAEPSISRWRSPTDFLLDTPGRQLLQAPPEIGGWHLDASPPSPPAAGRPL